MGQLSVKRKILRIFPAFRHINYRYYFFGQLISFTGSWLQTVAQGWLVFQLTHSPLMVGVVGALQFLPLFFFSLVGGVIADRVNKKGLLLITQSASLILAFALGMLTMFEMVNVWVVAVFAFLSGIVNAVDTPGRQSFAAELVSREHLPSAIAINMSTFNSARIVGPALAGILIATVGAGGTFIINALTFLAPLIALTLMDIKSEKVTHKHSALRAIKNGVKFAYTHTLIKNMLLMTMATSIFGWTFITLLPVIAERIFHQTPFGLGLMYSSVGLGSVCGLVFISAFYSRLNIKNTLLSANILFVVSIILFSLTRDFFTSLTFLFFTGMGISTQMALVISTIQNNVENYLRGRIMSIFNLCNMGMFPIGNFLLGYLAENFNSPFALRVGASIVFVFSLYIFFTLRREVPEKSYKLAEQPS